MATLNIPQNGKAVNGRTKKPLPSVDLTAMVDLAFLLITFFMLTTSLSKMKALDLVKPVPIDDDGDRFHYPETRTMTILLGKHNQVVYYLGSPATAQMNTADIGAIQKMILKNKQLVAKTHVELKDKKMLVIIKPTNTSSYKNFVDVIDEMGINNIESYAVDDKNILSEENIFMKKKGI